MISMRIFSPLPLGSSPHDEEKEYHRARQQRMVEVDYEIYVENLAEANP